MKKKLAKKEKSINLENVLEKDINILTNIFNKNEKQINEFYVKLAEQIWQDYICD